MMPPQRKVRSMETQMAGSIGRIDGSASQDAVFKICWPIKKCWRTL